MLNESNIASIAALTWLVWALHLASTTTAAPAGAAGKCLVLGDYEIFLATDTLPYEMTELTVSWWNKNTIPAYDAEALQYLSDVETQTDVAFNWYGNAGPIFGPDRIPTPFPYESGDWTHFAFTWIKSTGFSRLYYNGEEVANGTMGRDWPLGPGGRFYFGRPFAPDWINRLYAQVDEIGFFNVSLNGNLIREVMSTSPAAIASSIPRDNVLAYFSFDNIDNTAPYTIRSDFGGAINARIVQSPYSILEGLYYYPPVDPPLAPSAAPFVGSGRIAVSVRPNIPVSIDLVGPSAGTITIEALPSLGSLFQRDASGNKGTSISANGTVVTNGGVIFETSSALPSEISFDYSIGNDTASVSLMPNRAPTPRNTTFYMRGDSSGTFWLGRRVYRDFSAALPYSLYTIDPDGDLVNITLLNVPSEGDLAFGDVILTAADMPYTFDGSVQVELTYTPPPGAFGAALAYVDFTVTDFDLVSPVARITFRVEESPKPPVPVGRNFTLAENDLLLLNFTEARTIAKVHEAIPSSGGVALEPVYVKITDFPKLGRLFQGTPQNLGNQLFLQDLPQPRIRMWASEVPNVSSFWYDETGDFAPERMLGEPNLFPEFGDDGRAWSPADQDKDEWIIVKWPQKVFLSGLEVYQTYFGGTTRRISALDYSTGDFIHVWEADPLDIIPRKGTAYLFRPSLCPLSFATDTLKLEFAPAGPASYVEIDAIALTGTLVPEIRNLVNLRDGRITYVPDTYVNGNDSFTFSLNKCSYSSRYGTEGVGTADIHLSISAVNQRPVAKSSSLTIDATVANVRVDGVRNLLNVSDIETRSDLLRVTIRTLPSFGQLSSSTDKTRALRAGDSIPAGELLYMPSECTESTGIINATFTFVVSDPEGASSDEASVVITVDCLGPSQRIPIGSQIFILAFSAFGSTVSIVALLLVVVWRNTRTIRSISPLFCIVTLLGSLLVNLSTIFLTPLASSCMAWLCLLTLGVVLFFTPIAAKTYRLNSIFNNKSMSIFTISNLQLMGYVGIPAGIQAVLLLIWGLVHVPTVTQVVNPGALQTIPTCVGKITTPTLVVELVLLLLLYVFTAYYAFKVRNIPLGQWKETREIFLAVYQVGFVSLVVIPLSFVLWFTATGYMLIVGVGTNFACTISVIILFVTKFYRIGTDQEKSARTHITSATSPRTEVGSGMRYTGKAGMSSASLSFQSSHKSTQQQDESDDTTSEHSSSSSSSSSTPEPEEPKPKKKAKSSSAKKSKPKKTEEEAQADS